MSRSGTHIIKREDSWAVKRQGAHRASKVYRTQEEAVKGAKRSGRTSEIVVHNRNGSIRKWIKNK